MKARISLLNSSGLCVLLLLAVAVGFAPTKARAQSILDDLGSKKNGAEDIANSLVGAPPKYGKGEKKEQINATQLKSKSIKDSTFSGSLLDEGITGSQPKLDEKVHSATVAKDSRGSEQPEASKEASKASSQSQILEKEPSFRDISQTAVLAQELDESGVSSEKETNTTSAKGAASGAGTDDTQKKNQSESTNGTATATGKQTSTSATENPSPSKTDGGDH
jgi:hypothetical protein